MSTKSLSISKFRQKRNGNKWELTKAIQEIESLISEKGSPTKIQYLKNSLGGILNASVEAHEELMLHIEEGDPDFSDEWIEALSLRVNTCNSDVENHLFGRKDDPPSNLRSSSSIERKVQEWGERSLKHTN